jgi:hypothetical protein
MGLEVNWATHHCPEHGRVDYVNTGCSIDAPLQVEHVHAPAGGAGDDDAVETGRRWIHAGPRFELSLQGDNLPASVPRARVAAV